VNYNCTITSPLARNLLPKAPESAKPKPNSNRWLKFVGFLPLLCCSCSMVLVNTIPTKPDAALQPGAWRQKLMDQLGKPQFSGARPLTTTAFVLRTNELPAICDVYRISGLVQLFHDPYVTDWNVYPAVVILSFGLSEVWTFPYVIGDLTVLSFQRYEFRAWYNSSDELIGYERRTGRELSE